jgi:hypothetical protein
MRKPAEVNQKIVGAENADHGMRWSPFTAEGQSMSHSAIRIFCPRLHQLSVGGLEERLELSD